MTQNSKRTGLLAITFFVVYAALTLLITSRQMPPTGDEPHYLMAAHSLAVDHDLSLRENYLNKDYRVFYPADLAKRTTLSPDRSRELPAFSPGLSFFLTPFYWLSVTFFPGMLVPFLRLLICCVSALGLWITMLLYRRFDGSGRGLVALPVFAFASPLVTYSSMFYPEILAFFLLALSVLRLDEAPERPLRSAVWLTFLAPALIWLHPKYLALSFLLLALTAHRFYAISNTTKDRRWRVVPLLQAAGIAAFFVFLHAEYGSWSPNRIYGGVQRDTGMLDLLTREGAGRLWIMARMLFAYWIDQRFGILVYAPAYIAFFPGALWCWKRYRARLIPAFVLFAAHFLLISWGAQMGGYAPPSRHFVVLLPLILLPVLAAFSEWNRIQRGLFWLLSGLGLAVSVVIFTHYRLIFTNATWRNPDGYSELWSWLNMQFLIPRLTTSPPDVAAAAVWTLTVLLLARLLYPGTSPRVRHA